jgi:hypothetical protein
MLNWDSVHECEDEHDAERLRKRAQLSVESKALTSSLAVNFNDNDLDFTMPTNPSKRVYSRATGCCARKMD